MQHSLAAQYDLMQRVADLVSAHGTHDFSCGGDGTTSQASFYGLSVFFAGQLPVRLVAVDLDVTLSGAGQPQGFDRWLLGNAASHELHDTLSTTYSILFAKGDMAVLARWRDTLQAFVATTTRKAA